jgi:hypothetical protein
MTAVPITPPETSVYDAMRPFALLAVVAFVLGFAGYVALGAPAISAPEPQAAVVAAPALAAPAVAGPASDDWNLPKHI